MFLISRRNPFTGLHYRIKKTEVMPENMDILFNKNVHDNDKFPFIIDPYVCGYCGVGFISRNKLFFHLGYMGINISCAEIMSKRERASRIARKKLHMKAYEDISSMMKKVKLV